MRRHSSSILSLSSLSNKLTLFQILKDSVLFRKQKNQFQKLFAFLVRRREVSRSSIMVSFFHLLQVIVVDKSIDLVIPAHDTEIGAMAVNPDGTLIASASQRGHIIKIYSTDGGEVVQELKRGNQKAEITSIVFHPTQYLLACTSSKSSIHLFEIRKAVEKCIQTR